MSMRAAVASLLAIVVIATGTWYVASLLLGPLLHAWLPR
jgi:hypothetical protein